LTYPRGVCSAGIDEVRKVRVTIPIGGMTCGHCVRRVRDALAGLPGVTVEHVEVGLASVDMEPAVTSVERLVAAVRDLGYSADGPEAA
jgi:copper chaperone CopZ